MTVTSIARDVKRIRVLMFTVSFIALGMCAFVAYRLHDDHSARVLAIVAIVAITILLQRAASVATRLNATLSELMHFEASSTKDNAQ